jgi:hypothetical protein
LSSCKENSIPFDEMRWDGDEGDDEGDDDDGDDDDDDNALFALQFDFALCSVSSHLNNRCIG